MAHLWHVDAQTQTHFIEKLIAGQSCFRNPLSILHVMLILKSAEPCPEHFGDPLIVLPCTATSLKDAVNACDSHPTYSALFSHNNMAGIASRFLHNVIQSASHKVNLLRKVTERTASEYLPAALLSDQVVKLTGTAGAAAAIGGPSAGVVAGVAQIVSADLGEFFRLRATQAQMEAQMSLLRYRMIFGFVENVSFLFIMLSLVVLFRKAFMALVRKLDVNEFMCTMRSWGGQPCASRNENEEKKNRDGNGDRNRNTEVGEIDGAAANEDWAKCECGPR